VRRSLPLALLSGVLIAAAATLVSGSSRQAAVAEDGCSNHSLRGAYGFAVEGQAFNPPGPGYHEFAEFADAGRIVFDGGGNLNGTDTESLNGLISTGLTFSGTYSVQTDCTGTAVISGGITAKLRFMLVEGGQEVNVFDTDLGLVASGQITKQQLADCTNASLKGVYSFAVSGSVLGASGEAGDVAAFARLVVDGRGHSTESSNSSFNGAQVEDTQAGTYSVNPDCTGSAASTHTSGPLTGQVDHVNFVIVEGGAEVKVIVTDPGAVFAGTVDKQPMDAD